MDATRFEEAFKRVEALMAEWRLEEATRELEALKGEGGYPNRLRHDLSVLYAQQGLFDEALAEIEAALEVEPGNRALWHHFLAIQKNNPAQPTPREWRAMHLAFGDTLRDRHDERHLGVERPEGRRLRLGLLCPDTHLATGRFVWPLLQHLDAAAFEVIAYWAHATELAPLERDYPAAQHRSLRGLDDAAVVSLLLADAIDVAIDIAGHGAANVLTALARRPAPVALTWLDYLATTGMAEVDFRITDGIADPAGAEEAHVERLLRLDRAQWCYRPPAPGRDAPVTARKKRGAPVFGAISVPLKLSAPLLDLWAQLLEHVPGSTLRFLGIPEGRARARIVERFAVRAIDAARLEFQPRLEPEAFLRALTEIDVALDTYPFSGATSTLDALWQGVPVVTLAGPLSHGRSTASILTTLGRPQWIARGADELVRTAANLAGDGGELDRERHALRADLAASPLCDGPTFAAGMGSLFRTAWESRPRVRVDARREATDFWQGVKAMEPAGVDRVSLIEVADVVGAGEAAPKSDRGWLLLTHRDHFDPSTMATTVPAELLDRFDLVAPIGTDALVNGDLLAAGEGHVGGARIVAEDDRLYAEAWIPGVMGTCVALAGGALLIRKSLVAAVPGEVALNAADFIRVITRVSHVLHRKGARLGILPSLAAAHRAWPTPQSEWKAQRELERELGLPRWGQQRPGARAMKAVVSRAGWEQLRAAVDARLARSGG